ncbi:hypothetical protein AQB9606_02836 [Aquabacterium sp. CECT 9606]|nr:hypothetical protein AQB9606_02836 [Aquabacterium sp. CECT 9606]
MANPFNHAAMQLTFHDVYYVNLWKRAKKALISLWKRLSDSSKQAQRRFPIHAESTTKEYAVLSSIA